MLIHPDFSPTPAHSPDVYSGNRFFGWIIPTLRTSEFTVLQTVGLDAAVVSHHDSLLGKPAGEAETSPVTQLLPDGVLALCAVGHPGDRGAHATQLLCEYHLPRGRADEKRHGSTDAPADPPTNSTDGDEDFSGSQYTSTYMYQMGRNGTRAGSLTDLLSDPQTSSTINLIFTYLFTALTLTFLHRNFHRFVQSRQSFALHLIHSVSSRTVLVTEVPKHLRGDKALADYFENCGWSVESVSVVREMDTLKRVLESRTNALLKLEGAWTDWVGNPAKGVEGYDPHVYGDGKKAKKHRRNQQSEDEPLIPGLGNGDGSEGQEDSRQAARVDEDVENQNGDHHCHSHIHTHRPRPTLRPRPLGNKVDAIDHWEKKFAYAHDETRSMRQKGRFEATGAAFVTFEDVKSAVSLCARG